MTNDEYLAIDLDTLSEQELRDLAKAHVKEEKSSTTGLMCFSGIAAAIFILLFYYLEDQHMIVLSILVFIPGAMLATMFVDAVGEVFRLRKTKRLLDPDPDAEKAKQYILNSREEIKKERENLKKYMKK